MQDVDVRFMLELKSSGKIQIVVAVGACETRCPTNPRRKMYSCLPALLLLIQRQRIFVCRPTTNIRLNIIAEYLSQK
jgi:hypothetical protein